MRFARLLANIAVAIILSAILIGLIIIVFVETAERGAWHNNTPARFEQNIPFGGKK